MDTRLLILALGMFALGTDNFVVAGVLPEMSRSFDVSIGAAGQLTTVYAVAYALLSPTIAALTGHISRKVLLITGLIVFVLANLGTAMAPNFALAIVSRVVAGLGAALFSPTATAAAASIVPAERRGVALSVVTMGLTISTALGAPIGTLIGGLTDWHWTMVFVALLAGMSAIGISVLLSHIPMLPVISLRQRLSPLADTRMGLTLATTFLFLGAAYTIYTYLAVVFDRATDGNPTNLAGLLVLWGVSGTVSTFVVGRLIDVIGNGRVLVTLLAFLMIDFVLLPWTSGSLVTAIPAMLVWGFCGWGAVVPQQHRIVSIASHIAPLALGLNNTAMFLGVTLAGLIGAAGIHLFGSYALGYIAAALAAAALMAAEIAARKIAVSAAPSLAPDSHAGQSKA
ncbi:MFS transporter [Bradyrhizobium sp. Tv2a-2]|uniref:MFS transporter n=1 Tax=Bradyrhizobium sp. Tv2a-2 TaxID=113395 RepID=UPI000465A81D|nr:MFS transporter [Bradyrhizobium sp. Tv2a-2]